MTTSRPRLLLAAFVLLGGIAASRGASALTQGQTDTFEDGTTQGWVINLLGAGGSATPPTNVASGGPGGADDNYLQLVSTGLSGPGGRLTAINLTQWAGDYVAAGVTGISASLRNFGANDLLLRLYFADPVGGPLTNDAISTDAILVPSGSGWVNVIFPIASADLTAITGSIEEALSGATELRILHSPTAVFPPTPFAALLGVDNVTAVPEPSAGMLLGLGLLGLAARRRGYAPRSRAETPSGS